MTRDDLVKRLEKAAQRQAATRDQHISISLSATEAVFRAGDALHIWDMAYAAGVKDEREKSLRLWMLLDEVDTADDIAKSDDAVYRSLCRQAHQKRWAVLTGDEVDAIRARGEK